MNQNEKELAALTRADKLIRFEDSDPQWVRMQKALEAIQEAKSALESQPVASSVGLSGVTRHDLDVWFYGNEGKPDPFGSGRQLFSMEKGLDAIFEHLTARQPQAPAVEVPSVAEIAECIASSKREYNVLNGGKALPNYAIGETGQPLVFAANFIAEKLRTLLISRREGR